MVEGYHVFVGGGYGAEQGIGREMYRNVTAEELAAVWKKCCEEYLPAAAPTETFNEFVKRLPTDRLKEFFETKVGHARMKVTNYTDPDFPETAPFSPAQRAWLNGFFAGAFGIERRRHKRVRGPVAVGRHGDRGRHRAGGGGRGRTPLARPGPVVDERLKLADGKPLERHLMAAMAQLDCGACGYLCQTYSEAIARGEDSDLTRCAPGGKETAKKLKELVANRNSLPTVATEAVPPTRKAPPKPRPPPPTALPSRGHPTTAKIRSRPPFCSVPLTRSPGRKRTSVSCPSISRAAG